MKKAFIIADNQDITKAGIITFVRQLFFSAPVIPVAEKNQLASLLMQWSDAVVILDYTLFDFKSFEDLLILKSRFRNSHWILFSNELSESVIRKAGVSTDLSILLKTSSREEITACLNSVAAGKHYVCKQIVDFLGEDPMMPDSVIILTASEKEILQLIAQGKTVKEIAQLRISSVHTIVTHKKNLFRKLEVNNVYEATRYALRAGLVELAEYYI